MSNTQLQDKSYEEQLSNLFAKLREALGCDIVYGLQAHDKPKYDDDWPDEELRGKTRYPFIAYTFQSIRRVANLLVSKPAEDGININTWWDEQYEFTISFSAVTSADKPFESIELAQGLQNWLSNVGREWMMREQIVNVSQTPILPRDFFLVNDYERRNGTDIRLRLGRQAETLTPRVLSINVQRIT